MSEPTDGPMETLLLPTTSGGRDVAQLVLAGYDAPAFIKRARQVALAYDDLLIALGKRRAEGLAPVRDALEEVFHLAGSWPAAEVHLRDGLADLVAQVVPRPLPEHPPVAAWRVRWALADLVRAIERFNADWADHLDGVDLTEINRLRDGYNRYYVVEKECVVRNAVVAAAGFRPLPPVTVEHLGGLFPPLPVPRLT